MLSLTPVVQAQLLAALRSALPDLRAVYLFGSYAQQQQTPDSDLDLAVLTNVAVAPAARFALAQQLANLLNMEVDLVDFRAASTVLQAQILLQGQRWWASDAQVDAYEAGVLNDKLALDEARAGLLSDIQARGSVYGR